MTMRLPKGGRREMNPQDLEKLNRWDALSAEEQKNLKKKICLMYWAQFHEENRCLLYGIWGCLAGLILRRQCRDIEEKMKEQRTAMKRMAKCILTELAIIILTFAAGIAVWKG